MTDTERAFSKHVLEAFLSSRGLSCHRIPESNRRTPDYLIRQAVRDVLLELKIKSDDPDEMAESLAALEAGLLASRSKPLRPTNTVSGVICDGAKQMIEHDTEQNHHHLLWLHASGHDAFAYREQLRHTLYGIQRIFSSERPELIHCYFFRESEFWRWRKTLAGAVVSKWSSQTGVTIQLCINPHYSRHAEFRGSEVYRALNDCLLEPEIEADGDQVFMMDGASDRRDVKAVLEYLRSKYLIQDLQPFDLGFHTAGLRVSEQDRPLL